jgi:hypothetical protein
MAVFQPRQQRLVIRKRQFHFVAYEATPGNAKREEEPTPAMWFLMVEGRRCPAIPFETSQPEDQVELALTRWVKANALGPVRAEPEPVETPELWEE